MEKRKLYVTLEESQSKKIKLFKPDELGLTYASLVSQVQQKFKLTDEKVRISAKVEKDGLFVEIEEDDEDLADIIQEAVELKVTVCKDPVVLYQGESSQLTQEIVNKEAESHKATSYRGTDSASTETLPRSLDLQSLLATHPRGGEITKEYKRNKTLTPQTRINLVNIVCASLVEKHGYYPSPYEKDKAASSIIQLFPNLRDKGGKSGYEHFFCAEGGQTGYIQSRLKNIRRHLSTESKQKPRHNTGSSSKDDHITLSMGNLPAVNPDRAKELADFCRNAPLESKPLILKAMKEFTGNRINWIKENSPPMVQILKEYPQYLEIPETISQDFEQMFGEEISSNFVMKWINQSKLILKYMKNSSNRKLSEISDEFEKTHKTDEMCALYALLGLIHLLPSFNTKRKGKCSKEDNVRFFFDNQPIGTNVEDYVKRKDALRKQPYIVAIGGDINNIQQYFIALEEKPIPIPRSACGIIYAADLLVKSHFVFNIDYAIQLQDFYMYLQLAVYGISVCVGQKQSNRVKEVKIALETIEEQELQER